MTGGLGTRWRVGGAYSTPGAAPTLWRAAWRVAPGLAAVAVADALFRGLANPLRIVALGALVDALSGPRDSVGRAAAVLVALVAAQSVVPHLTDPIVRELARRVDLHLRRRVATAAAAPTGVAPLEDPRTADLIATAQNIGVAGSPGGSILGYLNLLAGKLGALGSVFLLAQYRWWLGALVLVGSSAVRRRILAVWFRLGEALRGDVPELRLVAYLRDLALLPESAKELRVFGFVDWLLARHGHTWRAAMEGVWQRRRKIAAQMPAIVLAALTLALVAVAPIARGILSGEVDAGHAVVLIGALAAIIGLGGFLPEADFPIRFGATALPAVAELEARLTSVAASARPQTVGVPAAWREVSFRDVTFRYPGGDEAVLDRLDLTIRRGETVAIVGANGAGKTTLTKLLAGLYDPCSGSLCVDDVDLADIDVAAWRRTFAVIFQDFVRFELSARDNVGFGSVHLLDDTVALERVAERAAISSAIHALPLGWDSPLARSYTGGADLSGGQWQRVALARALLAVEGGASLLVLDEPTASLDVRAEAEFYDRFVDLERGTTTVLISHRFSTVRRADRICVLEGGRVTEDGTHDELLGGGGRYAEMFRLQAARFG